jgi:hypothetical protein
MVLSLSHNASCSFFFGRAPQGLFTLVGAYFGYRHMSYGAIILLTVINTVYFQWWATLSF